MNRELSNIDSNDAVKGELKRNLESCFILKDENLNECQLGLFRFKYPKNWTIMENNIDLIGIDVLFSDFYNDLWNETPYEQVKASAEAANNKPIVRMRPNDDDNFELKIHFIDTIKNLNHEEFHRLMNDTLLPNSSDFMRVRNNITTMSCFYCDVNFSDIIYKKNSNNSNNKILTRLKAINYKVDNLIYSIRCEAGLEKFSIHREEAKKVFESFIISKI